MADESTREAERKRREEAERRKGSPTPLLSALMAEVFER